MTEIDYNLRTVISSDRSRLANLIHFGAYLHQHLDWKPALDWIGGNPYLILENRGEILATLACPPELPEISWIRLFAVSSLISVSEAWQMLWDAALPELSRVGGLYVAAISLQNWFNDLLVQSKFEYVDDVIVLMWEKSSSIPEPSQAGIKVRPMNPEDIDLVETIDHSSFDSIWKNSRESLELAYQQSSITSVAEFGDEIVGYQFSTSSSMGGHLARLAVKKALQGKGIGYFLVHDLLNQFTWRGTERVTVNTQKNNQASLSLYSKAGFKMTGEAYRVYQRSINE